MSSHQEEPPRDFEPPSSTPKRNKVTTLMSPGRSSRGPAASAAAAASPRSDHDEDTFGRPRSWLQYDRRAAGASDVFSPPFYGGQVRLKLKAC